MCIPDSQTHALLTHLPLLEHWFGQILSRTFPSCFLRCFSLSGTEPSFVSLIPISKAYTQTRWSWPSTAFTGLVSSSSCDKIIEWHQSDFNHHFGRCIFTLNLSNLLQYYSWVSVCRGRYHSSAIHIDAFRVSVQVQTDVFTSWKMSKNVRIVRCDRQF